MSQPTTDGQANADQPLATPLSLGNKQNQDEGSDPVPDVKPARDSKARRLAVIALIMAALDAGWTIWQSCMPLPPATIETAASQPVEALRQRVLGLEETIEALKQSAKTTPADAVTQSQDRQSLDIHAGEQSVTAAMTDLNQTVATLRDRLHKLEEQTQHIGVTQQALETLQTDVASTNNMIGTLRSTMQQMTDGVQASKDAEVAVRAQLIAFLELRAAAATAAPFVKSWETFCRTTQSITAMAQPCADMDQPAHGGVATLPMVQARFAVMRGAAEQAMMMTQAKTWIDRLKAAFNTLIHIRRVDGEANKDDTAYALQQIGADLQRGTIDSAISKVEALPPAAQKELREWLVDARARVELDAALAHAGALLATSPTSGSKPAEGNTP